MFRQCAPMIAAVVLIVGCGDKSKKPQATAIGDAETERRVEAAPAAPATPPDKDCVDYMPEGLASAAGFRPAELEKSKSAQGVLKQLGTIVGTLERIGLKLSDVEHVWVGSNAARGDLILCARTNNDVNVQSIKLKLDQRSSKRVEGLDVLPVADGGKNALCIPNRKTVIAGRLATVERALRGGASPARKGYDISGGGAAFWFAGDQKAAVAHIAGGSTPLFDLAPEALRAVSAFGVGVNVGEKQEMAIGWELADANAAKTAHGAIKKFFEDRKRDGGATDSSSSSDGNSGGGRGPGLRGAGIDFVEPPDSAVERARRASFGVLEQRGRRTTRKQSGGNEPDGGNAAGEGVGGLSGDDGAPGGRRGQGAGKSRGGRGNQGGEEGQDQDSAGERFAASGLKELKAEYQLSETDGSQLRLLMRYEAPIVPFSSIVAKALGSLVKGDETFKGTLDSIGSSLTGLLTRTGEPLKGLRRVDKAPIVYGYSWMCELLPHLGYEGAYDKIKYDKSWIERDDAKLVAAKSIAEFLDPSDSQTRWKGYPFDGFALTHFVGVAGVEETRMSIAAELPRTDPNAGIFGYERVARLDEIKDGAANTIMLIGAGKLKGLWIQGGGATIRGAAEPFFDPMTGFGNASSPNKGAFAVMADGSVREFSRDIDPKVFKALCTIAGQEKTP